MEIVNVVQGSPEWHALRSSRYTASEAPVMMGASSKASRNDLLRVKASGNEAEVSDWVQKNLYDKGHEYEEAARPIAERFIGEELFRAVVTEEVEGLPLLASCDGLTMLGDTGFEHKMFNQELISDVYATDLRPEYYWQLEHQILVTGAERVLFMVSDGTEENAAWMLYKPVEGRREQLIAAWKQFDADLAEYEPREEAPEAVGRAPENLPALRIEVSGEVRDSNLDSFREHAVSVIESINTDLQNDEDFANADKTTKWCKEVEERLEAAKQHALSQTESIDELFRTIDDIREKARQKRLELDKLVKARKQTIRDEIVRNRKHELDQHIGDLERSVEGEHNVSVRIDPLVDPDFAGSIKGKKTIKSLRDAADTELARCKVLANEWAEHLRKNLTRIHERGEGYESLFPDAGQIAKKAPEDVEATIQARIAEHEATEKRREEQRQAEEQRRKESEQERQDAQAAAEPTADAPPAEPEEQPAKAEKADDGARIKLSDINNRIAPLRIDASGLSQLGFDPVGRDKAAKLYRAADLPEIIEAMVRHIRATQSKKEAA